MSSPKLSVETSYRQDDDFWAKYTKARPHLPQTYFDMIFDYHARHGASFGVAHDVGCGPGIHTGRLLKRFDRVIASDPHQTNLDVAIKHLAEQRDQCEFRAQKFEDSTNLPAGSVDLVFAQTMIHFTDVDKAVEAAYHQLKPGGTLLISMAGLPAFKDPRVWAIWLKLIRNTCAKIIAGAGGPHGDIHRSLTNQISDLDATPVPEEFFLPGALRIKMNDPYDNFMMDSLLGPDMVPHFKYVSRIGTSDVVQRLVDEEGWTFKADIRGIRDIMATYPVDQDGQVQQDLWKELEEVLDGGETDGVWPCSVILATRRGS